MIRHALACCLLTVFAGIAFGAKPAPSRNDAIRIAPNEFAQSRADLEAVIRKTDRYSELTPRQREDLDAALDRMEHTLSTVTVIADLKEEDKTRLYNDQELVNNVLTQAAEDSRMVCKREKKVGSHRYTNVCHTVAERRRMRESMQRERLTRGQRGGDGLTGMYGGGQ